MEEVEGVDKVVVACVQERMRIPQSVEEYRGHLERFMRAARNKHARLVIFPELAGLLLGAPMLDDTRSSLIKRADQGRRRNASLWQRLSGSVANSLASMTKADLRVSLAAFHQQQHFSLGVAKLDVNKILLWIDSLGMQFPQDGNPAAKRIGGNSGNDFVFQVPQVVDILPYRTNKNRAPGNRGWAFWSFPDHGGQTFNPIFISQFDVIIGIGNQKIHFLLSDRLLNILKTQWFNPIKDIRIIMVSQIIRQGLPFLPAAANAAIGQHPDFHDLPLAGR
jgi:hypothetical protein